MRSYYKLYFLVVYFLLNLLWNCPPVWQASSNSFITVAWGSRDGTRSFLMDMQNVPDDLHLRVLKYREVSTPPVQPCGAHLGQPSPQCLLFSLKEDGGQKLKKADGVSRIRERAAVWMLLRC